MEDYSLKHQYLHVFSFRPVISPERNPPLSCMGTLAVGTFEKVKQIFIKHLWDTILGTGNTAVKKRDKTPYPYTLVGDTTKNLSGSSKCYGEK